MPKDLGTQPIVSLIHRKSEVKVCLHRIHTLLLQTVGLEFVYESDTASFLVHVEHDAFTFRFDHFHGTMLLFPAVATQGTEDISREAGRM